MGSGKSYWAKRLGEKHGLTWIDLDVEMEHRLGMSISAYFEAHGEVAFREFEAQTLRSLVTLGQVQLIACGGGTACYHDNMSFMNNQGFTIYLKTPVAVLVQRLAAEQAKRPLLQGLNAADLPAFIEHKLEERESYYQQAQLIWRTEHSSEADFDALIQSLRQTHVS